MALSCNAFATNTAGDTLSVSACQAPHVANLGNDELFPEQFMLLVLDSLQRLAADGGSVAATIENGNACDFSAALRNAACAMRTLQPQFQVTPAQMQAQILWVLNQSVCELP